MVTGLAGPLPFAALDLNMGRLEARPIMGSPPVDCLRRVPALRCELPILGGESAAQPVEPAGCDHDVAERRQCFRPPCFPEWAGGTLGAAPRVAVHPVLSINVAPW